MWFNAMILVLGMIGFFAITLLPYRVSQALKQGYQQVILVKSIQSKIKKKEKP